MHADSRLVKQQTVDEDWLCNLDKQLAGGTAARNVFLGFSDALGGEGVYFVNRQLPISTTPNANAPSCCINSL